MIKNTLIQQKSTEICLRVDDVKGRISGGRVTSTVLYCWVAAIVTRDTEAFVCTGSLVAEDLVITSGSCISQ